MRPETHKGVDIFPKIEALESQLGVPGLGWTPEFLDKLYASLWNAEVNGVSLIQPFDPNTVCNITWLQEHFAPEIGGSKDQWRINTRTCKEQTFPFRAVYYFYDGRLTIIGAKGETLRTPIIGVVAAIWNPYSQKTELRTFAVSEVRNDGSDYLQQSGSEGLYLFPAYNIKIGRATAYEGWMIDWFKTLSDQTGQVIHDESAYNAAVQSAGWYDERLNHMVMFEFKGFVSITK